MINWQRISEEVAWLGMALLAALFLGAILSVTNCRQQTAVPVELPPAAPTATAPPIEPETPPLATAPLAEIRLEPLALHGRPPYAARFNAALNSAPGQPLTCRALFWDFGDGTGQPDDCAVVSGETWAQLVTQRRYEQPGTYYARLRLTLADDSAITSPTQTVVVAEPQAQSGAGLYWAVWLGTMAGVTAVALWLRRRSRRQRWLGYGALFLLLIAFVPPFSYVPDPLGLVLGPSGLYRSDPRLPLVNKFVLSGDPTESLRPYLDALIGQTGLDPLDPVQPLARYDFVRMRGGSSYTSVGVRMTYADGSQRTYDVPLYQPRSFFGFYQSGWRYDGLGRLRAEHRELGSVPLAMAGSPVRLAAPQPVTAVMPPRAFGYVASAPWFYAAPATRSPLALSPSGDALLVIQSNRAAEAELWRVSLTGGEPVRVARNVNQAGWSADGRAIVYTGSSEIAMRGETTATLYLADGDGGHSRRWATLKNHALPYIGNDGVWYLANGRLWFLAYELNVSQPRANLQNVPSFRDATVSLSPDEQRVAYACAASVESPSYPVFQLCLQDADGRSPITLPLNAPYMNLAWRPDGQQLAVVQWSYWQTPITLTLLTRNGDIIWQTRLADEGQAASPQWQPDGRRLFVQTFPQGGRRIMTIDAATGEALDLSRPRWDVFFTLYPDGEQMLLGNGRGGLWRSRIELGN